MTSRFIISVSIVYTTQVFILIPVSFNNMVKGGSKFSFMNMSLLLKKISIRFQYTKQGTNHNSRVLERII